MKKLIALTLALVLAIAVAACGNGNSSTPPASSASSTAAPQVNGGASSEKPTERAASNGSPDITKEDFLSWFGLTEDDFMPGGFVNLEIYGCTTKEGTVYIQIDENGGTKENVQAWFESFFDKLKQVSDDGKLYDSFAFDKEYALPASYGNIVGSMFAYRYQGKGVLVNSFFDPVTMSLSKNEIKKISSYEIVLAME